MMKAAAVLQQRERMKNFSENVHRQLQQQERMRNSHRNTHHHQPTHKPFRGPGHR
jgi:hypothetical protein